MTNMMKIPVMIAFYHNKHTLIKWLRKWRIIMIKCDKVNMTNKMPNIKIYETLIITLREADTLNIYIVRFPFTQ